MQQASTRETDQTLCVAVLYPLVAQIDKKHADAVKKRLPPRLSDTMLNIISILFAVFVGIVTLLAVFKSVFRTDDASFWNPIASGLLAALFGLFVAWAGWLVTDMLGSLVRFYRNHLRDIDQGLLKDELAAKDLYDWIKSSGCDPEIKSSNERTLSASQLSRIEDLIRHLRCDVRIRTTRANFGAVLGALASVVMTSYDAVQKLSSAASLPEVPVYAGALSIGVLIGSALLIRFAGRLSRLTELLERVLAMDHADHPAAPRVR